MSREVVQDSDDDIGTSSPERAGPVTFEQGHLHEPEQMTVADRSGRGLREAHQKPIDECSEPFEWNGGQVAEISTTSTRPSTMSRVQQAKTTVEIVSDRSNERGIRNDMTIPLDFNSQEPAFLNQPLTEMDRQGRRAEIESIEEDDDVDMIPVRKRRHGLKMKQDLEIPIDHSEKTDMPPPCSQESINSQNLSASTSFGQSATNSVKAQPSPPRLRDNVSFTTTTSVAQSMRGSRSGSVQMFPALDSFSFQQQLRSMDLDQPTDIDSLPASQQDISVARDAHIFDATSNDPLGRNYGTQPTEHREAQATIADKDFRLKDCTEQSCASSEEQSAGATREEPDNEMRASEHPPTSKASMTLLRVEVVDTKLCDENLESGGEKSKATSSKKRQRQKRARKGTLVDSLENQNALDDPDSDSEFLGASEQSSTISALNRRGRRRKMPKLVDERGTGTMNARSYSENEVDQGDDLQGQTAIEHKSEKTTPPQKPVSATTHAALEDTPAIPNSPSRQPPSPGPGGHSPLNSGKVPMRVGLSKRMRIEPLLKMVRK